MAPLTDGRTTDNPLPVPDRTARPTSEWLWPMVPIGIAMFALSALLYYHLRHDVVEVRSVLQVAIAGIYRALGFAPAFLFFLLVLTWGSIWFATGRLERPVVRLLRLSAMTVMLGVLMNLGEGGVVPAFHKGELGAWLAGCSIAAFGYPTTLVSVWAITFAALLLATDFFFSASFERLRRHGPAFAHSAAAQAENERGVEAEVTDHFLGLANQVGSAAGRGPAGPAPGFEPGPALPAEGAPAPSDAGLDALLAEAAAPAAEPPAETFVSRREARRLRAARDPAPAELPRAEEAPEAWVPAAPESQEIENPESEAVLESGELEPGEPESGQLESGQLESREPVSEEEVRDDSASDPVASIPNEGDGAPSPGLGFLDAPAPAEPIVEIPRPTATEETAATAGPEPLPAQDMVPPLAKEPVRQQNLFGATIDAGLLAEAAELVTSARRASATFLQRKLRIDYAEACAVLAALAARGIVELEADASHGRVVDGSPPR